MGRSRIAAIRSGAGGDQPTEKPGVLRIGRHDLVARPDAEAAQHDVASLGRRAGEGDSLRLRPQQAREFGAKHLTFVQDSLKVARLDRPSSSSRRSTACMAATVARGSGPNEPVFR